MLPLENILIEPLLAVLLKIKNAMLPWLIHYQVSLPSLDLNHDLTGYRAGVQFSRQWPEYRQPTDRYDTKISVPSFGRHRSSGEALKASRHLPISFEYSGWRLFTGTDNTGLTYLVRIVSLVHILYNNFSMHDYISSFNG